MDSTEHSICYCPVFSGAKRQIFGLDAIVVESVGNPFSASLRKLASLPSKQVSRFAEMFKYPLTYSSKSSHTLILLRLLTHFPESKMQQPPSRRAISTVQLFQAPLT